MTQGGEVLVAKDRENEGPVPSEWRPTLREIVDRFSHDDYALKNGVENVVPLAPELTLQIKEYVADYGESLIPLPDDTWSTSVYIWNGKLWNVIVDLWTEGEGRSDLILHVNVEELKGKYKYHVHLVYVP